MKKIYISENEKINILKSHQSSNFIDEVVITDWLSPDERYCIFLDELYDIKNKIRIGNIWENFDNFKMFLKHSFEVSTTITEEIRESVLNQINSLVLTESSNNMTMLKPFVKQFLNEESNAAKLWNDFTTWGKETVSGAVKGVKDFAKTSWEGIKKTYSYIKDGDWKKAFDIIKKGTLYVARSLRSALYHPIGLILDAILIATEIGKGLQWIPWAIVVALDVYELVSGDYEDKEMSMVWRLLFLGIDILGLVTAGGVAKAGKAVITPLIKRFGKSTEAVKMAVKESPQLKAIFEKILSAASGVQGRMSQAQSYLMKKSPKIGQWIGGIIGKVGGFVQKIVNFIKSLVKGGISAGKSVVKAAGAPGRMVRKALGQETKLGKAAQAAVNVGGLVAGVGTYYQGKKREEEEKIEAALTSNTTQGVYDINNI